MLSPNWLKTEVYDRARTGDGELLAGDLLASLAEHLRVLEVDVRQVDDARPDDVGRVEPTAEARLDDGDVDGGRRELCERRSRQRLLILDHVVNRRRAKGELLLFGIEGLRLQDALSCGRLVLRAGLGQRNERVLHVNADLVF